MSTYNLMTVKGTVFTYFCGEKMLPRSCLVKLALSIQQAELVLFHFFFIMQIIFLYLFKTKPRYKLSCTSKSSFKVFKTANSSKK